MNFHFMPTLTFCRRKQCVMHHEKVLQTHWSVLISIKSKLDRPTLCCSYLWKTVIENEWLPVIHCERPFGLPGIPLNNFLLKLSLFLTFHFSTHLEPCILEILHRFPQFNHKTPIVKYWRLTVVGAERSWTLSVYCDSKPHWKKTRLWGLSYLLRCAKTH